MKKTFYSNGKLLITGEYLVLDGAKALAIPTKYGQSLTVASGTNNIIEWTSFDADGSIWFTSEITFQSIILKEVSGSENSVKNTLVEILHEAYQLNPTFITSSNGYRITTELTFPKFWGLGTSSTLLNNIAQWLEIDAYTLLKNSFGGSGYDIACAQNVWPISYQLLDGTPIIKTESFNPAFSQDLFFVYLNQKQSSREAIKAYYHKRENIESTIEIIDNLTQTILHTKDEDEFAAALKNHEIVMSRVLDTKTVQELLFHDFNGVIKSLGAWGGDFVLVFSKQNPSDYFNSRGYTTIIPFKEMIL